MRPVLACARHILCSCSPSVSPSVPPAPASLFLLACRCVVAIPRTLSTTVGTLFAHRNRQSPPPNECTNSYVLCRAEVFSSNQVAFDFLANKEMVANTKSLHFGLRGVVILAVMSALSLIQTPVVSGHALDNCICRKWSSFSDPSGDLVWCSRLGLACS